MLSLAPGFSRVVSAPLRENGFNRFSTAGLVSAKHRAEYVFSGVRPSSAAAGLSAGGNEMNADSRWRRGAAREGSRGINPTDTKTSRAARRVATPDLNRKVTFVRRNRVRTRRAGKVGECAGYAGRGLQTETGVGP